MRGLVVTILISSVVAFAPYEIQRTSRLVICSSCEQLAIMLDGPRRSVEASCKCVSFAY